MLGSGNTTLTTSNYEMKDVIKIIKSLEDPGLLLKEVGNIIHNEVKKQKVGCLSMLLGTLGASLLGHILAGKWMIGAWEGFIRAGYRSSIKNKDF